MTHSLTNYMLLHRKEKKYQMDLRNFWMNQSGKVETESWQWWLCIGGGLLKNCMITEFYLFLVAVFQIKSREDIYHRAAMSPRSMLTQIKADEKKRIELWGDFPVCIFIFTHMVSIRLRNVITNESVSESAWVPQLAWHLAWHIVAWPRPLPVCSNVAVDKPIKKPLLNALSALLFHALQHRPGGNASDMKERKRKGIEENTWK